MKVEFDRDACEGWFMCVEHMDDFEMNISEGKADLVGSEETGESVFSLELSEANRDDAVDAAQACPENAIRVYQDDQQIAPE